MDLDSGITDGADGHRQCQPLQQREVHVDVEPLGLAIGEAISNDLESFAHGIEMIESVGVGGKFEGGEHCLVDLFGRPAADGGATMQENFH